MEKDPVINLNAYYCRYHLNMPSASWRGLWMQEMAGGDNNRTSVKFQYPDIFVFVGVIHGAGQ